ncbi:MAG: TrpB-like pyridoxal phosphate-dependent enzyme, partial [Dehalococcoidia bacterium]|nr:TrpB-like pyridoxal phosphate-dependent enzyme [Dehalococcoidia bacterium]
QEGVKRLATETGAGQWGSALALGCQYFGLQCKVYMVQTSYHQKPYRRILMETWGAKVVPSPSEDTNAGRTIRAKTPDSPGSLGIAISEAVEDAVSHDDTKYALGSVLNHVLLHQTVIGLETRKQMEMAGFYPDMIVGCIGGGSNFAGTFLPFIKDKIKGKNFRIICVEPEACPSLTKGQYAYDFGDTAMLTPLLKMFTLGHSFVPPRIHAGGLRYHGMAPIVSHLHSLKLIEAQATHQIATFKAAVTFARTEGILPAPEPSHAIKVVIDEALKCKASGEKKTILLALSGHGHFDLGAYDEYLSGKLVDFEYPKELVDNALKELPKVG